MLFFQELQARVWKSIIEKFIVVQRTVQWCSFIFNVFWNTFGGRIISHRAAINQPPRSPNLIGPPISFCGVSRREGCMRTSLGQSHNCETTFVQELEQYSYKLAGVMEDVVERARLCEVENGHLEDVISHTQCR